MARSLALIEAELKLAKSCRRLCAVDLLFARAKKSPLAVLYARKGLTELNRAIHDLKEERDELVAFIEHATYMQPEREPEVPEYVWAPGEREAFEAEREADYDASAYRLEMETRK